MQAIIKGLEKLNQELTASESDGPVSEVFRKVCFSSYFMNFRCFLRLNYFRMLKSSFMFLITDIEGLHFRCYY